ncbi:MAG: hypothetical protein GX066_06980 [Clostridiaceae bacterium]|nr:hypothetical protein [Clostridiaceae bacterium]
MSETIANQYYVMQSAKNQQWHFFYHPNSGICYKKKSGSGWSDYEILFKAGLGDFDVLVDPKDNIHLVCQDKPGSIIYLMYNGQQWHKYILLQSKSSHTYPKYFKILFINGWINLLYIIRYKEKNMLVHQVLDNNNVEPSVLDYVETSACPFSASIDEQNNIHVYYKRSESPDKPGYRIYVWSKKSWSEYIPLDLGTGDASIPHVIIDYAGNIHMVYLSKLEKTYNIMYKRRPVNNFKSAPWDKEICVQSDVFEDSFPIIMTTDKRLWILWKFDLRVLSIFSDDGGLTWSNPSQFLTGRYGNITRFGCRISDSLIKNRMICDQCYGYITNTDVNLYIVSGYLEQIPRHVPKPEVKLPGYEVEEFASSHSSSPADKPSESNPESIENTKLRIMFNMLQDELSQIKKKLIELSQFSRMDEELKKYIDEKYGTEIKSLKEEFKGLVKRIEQIEKNQEDIIHRDIEKINKDISVLKRKSNKISFDDLIQQDNTNTTK